MTETKPKQKGNPPVAEIRESTVRIAIWERQGSDGVFFTAGQPELGYRDADGNWRNDGTSYGERDTINLTIAAGRAASKIRELNRAAMKNAVTEGGAESDPPAA